MKQLLILLVLMNIFVLPVNAALLEGTDDTSAVGTTSVTANIESHSDDTETDSAKTGDNSHWEEYTLLVLMSGMVIASSMVRLYRRE